MDTFDNTKHEYSDVEWFEKSPQTKVHHCGKCKNGITSLWTESNTDGYTCSICLHTFTTERGLYIHLQQVHSDKRYHCNYEKCSTIFTRKYDLLRHIRRKHLLLCLNRDCSDKITELNNTICNLQDTVNSLNDMVNDLTDRNNHVMDRNEFMKVL